VNLLLLSLAFAAGVLGAVIVYLGAPNQKLRARALPFRPAMIVGGVAILISLNLFLRTMGAAAAVFVLLVLLMTLWTALPFAAALLRKGKKA